MYYFFRYISISSPSEHLAIFSPINLKQLVWGVVLLMLVLPMYYFFRYISISSPSEHLAIFSPINLKLLVWGVVLLMLVVFLAPTYGWGEYSTMKGEINVCLTDPIILVFFRFYQLIKYQISNMLKLKCDIN